MSDNEKKSSPRIPSDISSILVYLWSALRNPKNHKWYVIVFVALVALYYISKESMDYINSGRQTLEIFRSCNTATITHDQDSKADGPIDRIINETSNMDIQSSENDSAPTLADLTTEDILDWRKALQENDENYRALLSNDFNAYFYGLNRSDSPHVYTKKEWCNGSAVERYSARLSLSHNEKSDIKVDRISRTADVLLRGKWSSCYYCSDVEIEINYHFNTVARKWTLDREVYKATAVCETKKASTFLTTVDSMAGILSSKFSYYVWKNNKWFSSRLHSKKVTIKDLTAEKNDRATLLNRTNFTKYMQGLAFYKLESDVLDSPKGEDCLDFDKPSNLLSYNYKYDFYTGSLDVNNKHLVISARNKVKKIETSYYFIYLVNRWVLVHIIVKGYT